MAMYRVWSFLGSVSQDSSDGQVMDAQIDPLYVMRQMLCHVLLRRVVGNNNKEKAV